MKVVVDTNIMVSALLSGGGAPRDVLRLCLEEKITPIFGTTLFADNHLVELAIAGGAEWIITANLKDFRGAELRFDHVRIGTAGMFLEERELRS